jgi:hypothetical protein
VAYDVACALAYLHANSIIHLVMLSIPVIFKSDAGVLTTKASFCFELHCFGSSLYKLYSKVRRGLAGR